MKSLHYDSIDSTNLQARRLWDESAPCGEPFVVFAEEQTAGIGRHGRSWCSPPGGAWMTVAWPAQRPLGEYQGLPLAAGHALASLLDNVYGVPAQIKWPNDVMVRGRKLAGILCQSQASPRPACIFIGVGVNANYTVEALDRNLRTPATSLQQETGAPVDLAQFRVRFVNALESVLAEFEQSGLRAFLPSIRQRLAWLGQIVHAEADGTAGVQGEVAGIDHEGRLLLKQDGRLLACVSGELQRLALGTESHALQQNNITGSG